MPIRCEIVSQDRLVYETVRVDGSFDLEVLAEVAGISLDELMNIRAPHTYLARADGESMIQVGIFDRDILIIDRGREAEKGEVIIAALNNEPLVKIFDRAGSQVILRSANPKFPPRYLLESEELYVWGVVSYSIRIHGKY